MKVKIGNHKSCLYQWDTGQFVVIDGAEQCNEIHFCNDRSKNALVVKIIEQDGKRIANIPNILLQNDGNIYVYLFIRNEDGSETRTSASFPVRGRKKPENYVYTETEKWTYDNIERRLDDLEDSMTHGTVKSINGLIPDANGNVELEIPEGITGSGVIVSETEPEDTSVLWVDTDEDEVDNVQDVINEALARAKASGEFDGKDGNDGKDYVLTEDDKAEIAEQASEMVGVSPPDWNQNDPEAKDYINNRPFYEESELKYIIPETTVNISEGSNYEILSDSCPLLTAGQTYIVTLNGTTYNCVARTYDDDDALLGNGTVYGDGNEGNGEPFAIDSYMGGEIYLNVAKAGTYTVSIVEIHSIVNKLDPKYLSAPDWNQNDPEGEGYIKNRPFYDESTEITWADEQTITIVNGRCYDIERNEIGSWPTIDSPYTVVFDGVAYSGNTYDDIDICTHTDFTTSDGVFVEVRDCSSIYVDSTALDGEHTISITFIRTKVRKIDNKYIDYIVESVNGKTGHVYLNADDVGAVSPRDPVFTGTFSMNRKHGTQVGYESHTEGTNTTASGYGSHAEGYNTIATGNYSHAEGRDTTAEGIGSHAEGNSATASGDGSHAEGISATASGIGSHAEGYITTAVGHSAHSEGYYTATNSDYSHVEGEYTIARGRSQHVQGAFNVEDNAHYSYSKGKYAHIVGNGTSTAKRSNAHTLDWNGVGWYQGGLQVGGNAQDDGAKNVLLEGDAIPVPSTATTGQILSVKSVDENGKPTEWETVEIPEGGSNQPLTFTGAVNATYDGSQAVSVEIPVGGGSSGGLMGVEHTLLNTTVEIPADSPVTSITLDVPEIAKTCKAFQIFVYLSKPTNEHTATRTQVSICRQNLIYWTIGNTSATGGMGYWIIADCIKGIAYKKASPNSFSANSNTFNCEAASGLKNFPPSNSNNKFVFEMFSPYAGTVNIEVYGYN